MLSHHNARVNSHQRRKQTRFRVCFHLWCELTSTMIIERNDQFHGIHENRNPQFEQQSNINYVISMCFGYWKDNCKHFSPQGPIGIGLIEVVGSLVLPQQMREFKGILPRNFGTKISRLYTRITDVIM